MKRLLFTAVLLFSLLNLSAQHPAADHLKTSKGSIKIQPVFHGALILTWNNKTIYVDPYGGEKAFKGLAKPDMILITDIHLDHLDPETLKAIDHSKAIFIVPQAVADKLPDDIKREKVIILANGKNTDQMGISISAIPMYNLPESPEAMHTKGRGNGYILKMDDKTIYISGDTEDIPEMRSLKNIDVAFICMNLPYTMDINQASSAVLEFKPKIVYPYHYRGQDGLSDVEGFKKTVNTQDKNIEVRLRNWYTEYK
jgi:L-ascorbate metabolism protein UlaG (beta-lactamase superfamily)